MMMEKALRVKEDEKISLEGHMLEILHISGKA